MKKIKGISYDTVEDRDVVDHIAKQPLQNKYVWDLVRADMNKTDKDIEEIVKKYVEEILKDGNIKMKDKESVNISKNDVMDLLKIGN